MTVRRIPGYSKLVRELLDPARPKYSEAIKSFAAFAPDERMFKVLVAHLDDACEEVLTTNRRGRT
jgi:hypothetical protein